jgi:hypothetical protein
MAIGFTVSCSYIEAAESQPIHARSSGGIVIILYKIQMSRSPWDTSGDFKE